MVRFGNAHDCSRMGLESGVQERPGVSEIGGSMEKSGYSRISPAKSITSMCMRMSQLCIPIRSRSPEDS